jgi:hypothetical protein
MAKTTAFIVMRNGKGVRLQGVDLSLGMLGGFMIVRDEVEVSAYIDNAEVSAALLFDFVEEQRVELTEAFTPVQRADEDE